MRNIKKTYDLLGLLQIVLFIPFIFGIGALLFQLFEDYLIISHYNVYRSGFVIVSDKFYETYNTDTGGIDVTYSVGYINGVKILLDEDKVSHFVSKKNIQINDTIYVWYRNDGIQTLPRFKYEKKIKLGRYLHPQFRYLMLFGIPPFIILTIILRRIKKKYITDEKK